jgi:hypothetical protein
MTVKYYCFPLADKEGLGSVHPGKIYTLKNPEKKLY